MIVVVVLVVVVCVLQLVVLFYIMAHPHPLTGSTKGSGCLFPQIEGIIKSVVD